MSESKACPECRHIYPNGRRCHSPALRGKPLCYFHSRTKTIIDLNRNRDSSVALPPLEDRGAIQIAIDEVIAAHAAGKLDRHAIWPYLFAIQMASKNLAQAKEDLTTPEPVDDFEGRFGEPLAATDPEGEPDAAPIEKPSDLTLPRIDAAATHEYDLEPPTPPYVPPLQKPLPTHRRAGFGSRNEANQFLKAEYKWLENFHASKAGTPG
jgi:hypothetical protein